MEKEQKMSNCYRAGIDIGSTTVKFVVIDEKENLVFSEYRRHQAHTQETLLHLLKEARETTGAVDMKVGITGSGSINIAKKMEIPFVQEVVAVATAIEHQAPGTDVAIELGGEDAKIIYFRGGLDQRMNGICAGGTGSFIDQMASLLQTDATGLNEKAKDAKEVYSIAARCGVFAKTDIQPLINEGARREDLAASIFQAVVNQTISGLACGKPIRGHVAFLGGPLYFLSELKKTFIKTLHLSPDEVMDTPHSHLFAAIGAAIEVTDTQEISLDDLISLLENGVDVDFEVKRLEPLFASEADYDLFCARHGEHVVGKQELADYQGDAFLGIDAGSTTTKIALIGQDGQLLYHYYANNQGNPIETVRTALIDLGNRLPDDVIIRRTCSTGYGEALMKTAFCLDEGEVETIAHTTAASFFAPDVDCVLDIGGQDMKCIKLKNGFVDTIMLNEACSSGCGSFIENFANSLGYSVKDFARAALFAAHPVDLGTRCTVFMNSNVKQAQKEGAEVSDISAGLAYSVIKNALYKVIKLTSASDLGQKIVVQGGTFYNHAVLRAFEMISGAQVVCPDISGIMGAFGAALIARRHVCENERSSMISFDQIASLKYDVRTARCGRCTNNCMLTISTFPDGRRHLSGNRCERPLGNTEKHEKVPNLVEFKRKKIFGYPALDEEKAVRGVIGVPRVLNMYEDYPYWAVFFRELGFRIVLSPFSTRKIYELGMESIPSESECYPAKLAHGHIQWLIGQGIGTIFHPCVFYEYQETAGAQNRYNCPIVISYAENLKNNVEELEEKKINYVRPFISFASEKAAENRLVELCEKEWSIPAKEVREAARKAWTELRKVKEEIREEGKRVYAQMRSEGKDGIVFAGRPYHIDPEINHGIPEMIASYGKYVFTEDSLPIDFEPTRPLRVVDQWVFHSRLYSAAEYVCKHDDLELIQINSFGCGLDAVTTDQVSEILEQSNKLYTLLKIDEVNNLGAARIRIRSLISAINMRREKNLLKRDQSIEYHRTEFTEKMQEDKYTILAPQMSPIHFDLVGPLFEKYGYHVEILDNATRDSIDVGLKYVNNDACYPSIVMVGQVMNAVMSGNYNTRKLAVLMSQTGGCCRATNYVSFIRKALDRVGMSYVPVISLNLNGMEKNGGFRLTLPMIVDAIQALIYGDLFMKCLYHVRPYEKNKGESDRVHEKWLEICRDALLNGKSRRKFRKICEGIVQDFDRIPLDDTISKPRVGIVGEILVKYMPLANNHLVELLEREGAEAVVPDLLDFFAYSFFNGEYKHRYLGAGIRSKWLAKIGVWLVDRVRRPATRALENSERFDPPVRIDKVAEYVKPILSLGNQYGEGWFLAGEMVELLRHGTNNIICIQPFGCLPNHVVGKGVIKKLHELYPESNVAAVDYDPGASEVNQLNRIKLMLSAARKKMIQEKAS